VGQVVDTPRKVTRVSTPCLDLSTVTAKLTFDHFEKARGSHIDSLKVYYKTKNNDPVFLNSYLSGSSTLGTTSIYLPSEASVDSCYIIFEWVSSYSYGIGIDNIKIEAMSQYDAVLVSFVNPPEGILKDLSANETITVKGFNNGINTIKTFNITFEINGTVVSTETVSEADGIEIATGKYYDYIFKQKANLFANGTYIIRAWIDVAGDMNHNNDTVTISLTNYICLDAFDLSKNALVENFEAPLSPCWKDTINNVKNAKYTGVYNFNEAKNGSGVYRFSSFNYSSPGTFSAYLITPKLSTAEYKKVQFYYRRDKGLTDGFKIGYSTTTNNVSDFIWLADSIIGENITSAWQLKTTDEIPAEAKYIAIGYISEKSEFYIYVDSFVVSGYIPPAASAKLLSIVDMTGKIASMTNKEKIKVSFKNTGLDPVTNIKFSYQVNNGAIVTEQAKVNVAAGATAFYTFKSSADLSAVATYNIKAWLTLSGDADKSDDTGTVNVINTDCITNSLYMESFESDDVRNCLTFISMNTKNGNWGANTNWGLASSDFIVPKSGNSCFRFSSMNSSTDYTQYIITPRLPRTVKLRTLSFYYSNSQDGINGRNNETLLVGFSTTTDDLSSFVWVDTINRTADSGWRQYLKEDIGKNVKYIAILYAQTSSRYYAFIDDFSIYETAGDNSEVTDLHVVSFVDLPAVDTLNSPDVHKIPVKIAVRNDSTTIDNFNVLFNFNIKGISGEAISEVDSFAELFEDREIAKGEEFTFEFDDSATIAKTGTYKIKAWADLSRSYINLHNDTVEATILVVEKTVANGEVLKPDFKAVIYPNPSNGNFTIITSSRAAVEVLDIKGVVISRITVNGSKEISLKDKGVYVLRFIDSFGNKTAERVVVK
jgi:hypothetical protein